MPLARNTHKKKKNQFILLTRSHFSLSAKNCVGLGTQTLNSSSHPIQFFVSTHWYSCPSVRLEEGMFSLQILKTTSHSCDVGLRRNVTRWNLFRYSSLNGILMSILTSNELKPLISLSPDVNFWNVTINGLWPSCSLQSCCGQYIDISTWFCVTALPVYFLFYLLTNCTGWLTQVNEILRYRNPNIPKEGLHMWWRHYFTRNISKFQMIRRLFFLNHIKRWFIPEDWKYYEMHCTVSKCDGDCYLKSCSRCSLQSFYCDSY